MNPVFCDWCKQGKAYPLGEGCYGPFGDDNVCHTCEAAFWRWREERERELQRKFDAIPDTDHIYQTWADAQ